MGKKIRLDRFLADMGKGSRAQIKEAARKGRVQVNGQVERKTDRKLNPDVDEVTFDGVFVRYRSWEYFLLNKPKGVVSATEDGRYRTVVELLGQDVQKGVFPVGRLDVDTEGLLLLTNDGELAHRLLSPKKHVDKQYYAKVSGRLLENAVEEAAKGMVLADGTRLLPAKLEILKTGPESGEGDSGLTEIQLTLQEGKYHQVKRMVEALGGRVTYLKRLSMGPLKLDEKLRPGQYRRLTEAEIRQLKEFHGSCSVRQILRQKDAVIFDLDGTLVDSMWMWERIDIEYLSLHGHERPACLGKDIEGMSFSETAAYFKETFQLSDSLEQIKQTWIDMSIEKYRKEVPLKKGARRFLEFLRESGIVMGIATSNNREIVDAVTEALGIRSYFQVITTACEVAAGKPAPDVYLNVASRLHVKPERCVVFEDVPAGILAGKAAGMTVCAVADDFSVHMEEEKRQLAHFFLRDYDEIFEEAGQGEKNG